MTSQHSREASNPTALMRWYVLNSVMVFCRCVIFFGGGGVGVCQNAIRRFLLLFKNFLSFKKKKLLGVKTSRTTTVLYLCAGEPLRGVANWVMVGTVSIYGIFLLCLCVWLTVPFNKWPKVHRQMAQKNVPIWGSAGALYLDHDRQSDKFKRAKLWRRFLMRLIISRRASSDLAI